MLTSGNATVVTLAVSKTTRRRARKRVKEEKEEKKRRPQARSIKSRNHAAAMRVRVCSHARRARVIRRVATADCSTLAIVLGT